MAIGLQSSRRNSSSFVSLAWERLPPGPTAKRSFLPISSAWIVDSEDKIGHFVAAIEPIMGSALVTTEKVKVIRYGESGPSDTT